jgi:hypothetical protein
VPLLQFLQLGGFGPPTRKSVTRTRLFRLISLTRPSQFSFSSLLPI